MRSKEIAVRAKAQPSKTPKMAARPTKPAFFAKNLSTLPKEVKIVGALLLMLAALYVFHLASQSSFLKPQTNVVTGPVVSESGQQQPAATATATASEETKPQTPTQTAQQPKQASASGVPIKIVSPPKGSAQSPGFSVNIEVSNQVLQCYYSLKDNGQLTWDRRLKPCKLELPVSADHCKTAGKETCYVYVEATDGNGNNIGTDTAYYSIK